MNRFILASFSALALSASFASGAFAKPPSGDANPSDLGNSTVDTSQIIVPGGKLNSLVKQAPPSGDANPSDLSNRTVDTSQILNPRAK